MKCDNADAQVSAFFFNDLFAHFQIYRPASGILIMLHIVNRTLLFLYFHP